MEFLALEKMVETAPTELAQLESTSTMDFKENPEKSKKTQIRVKSYDQFFRQPRFRVFIQMRHKNVQMRCFNSQMRCFFQMCFIIP